MVEDEPLFRFFYKEILEEYGFEVVGIAKNGEEAVSMYKQFVEKPSIIIMDHRMPVKNGMDALKEILIINNCAIVIFASADKSVKEEVLSMGAHSFKQKPFDIDYLLS
ncbi:MAG: response regulator, partial [Candidatus Lokiarchaeota archaeon]|nr:response regulator [Candidatus Lokiarchaeota archaeon]